MNEGTVSANTIREAAPGIWVIDFPKPEDVTADKCGALVPPIEEASKLGPLIVVAKISPELRIVNPNMAPYWLEVFTTRVKTAGIAVVTRSMAVKVVVSAFHMAMKIREHPIAAETFLTEELALAWAKTKVPPRLSRS